MAKTPKHKTEAICNKFNKDFEKWSTSKKKKKKRERENMGSLMSWSRLGYKKAAVSVLGTHFCMVLLSMLRGVTGHDVS